LAVGREDKTPHRKNLANVTQVLVDEMGGRVAGKLKLRETYSIRILVENLKGRVHLGDLDVDGKVTLNGF
jgi:hypothetical protein